MSQIRLTTTGSVSPVTIEDLGSIDFPHPTVNSVLFDTSVYDNPFTMEEISDSGDLQAAIVAGEITVTDDLGNPITNIRRFVNNIGGVTGFADYNDASTTSSPVSLLAGVWTDIPNDGTGPYTNLSFLPDGVTNVLDTSTGYLDLSQLSLGDSIIIRNDFTVTPNVNRANLEFRYELGTGGGLYTLNYFVGRLDSGAGIPYRFNLYTHLIYLGDDNTRLNPVKLQLNCSKNATFKNSGTAIQILRK